MNTHQMQSHAPKRLAIEYQTQDLQGTPQTVSFKEMPRNTPFWRAPFWKELTL
jgi:hypothetical protein